MKQLILVMLLSLILFPTNVKAWGEKGHQLVAEIAFKQLDKKTKKILLSYLDGMSIEEASTWMDDIKKDHAYDKLKPLHYVNFDKGTVVKDTCCDNIIHTLTETINDLKHYKDFSKAEIKIKLCYLFHLIGDIHQPLHVGYGSDKGGNSFQVNFNGKGTNLHGLFDYGIIEYKNLKLKDCLKAKKYNSKELEDLNNSNVVDWAKESRSYLDEIYTTTTKIDVMYTDANYTLIKNQIQKAGLRLAKILEDTFKEKSN